MTKSPKPTKTAAKPEPKPAEQPPPSNNMSEEQRKNALAKARETLVGASETRLAAVNLDVNSRRFMDEARNVARRISSDLAFVHGSIRDRLVKEATEAEDKARTALEELEG